MNMGKQSQSEGSKSSVVGHIAQGQGHYNHLHLRSSIQSLVSSMDIRNYIYHVKLPSIFHHDEPQALIPPEGLNLQGLTDSTELAFHLIATWCTHHVQSPSSSAVLSKLSSEMIVYVRAIDLSIASAKCIFNLAEEALGLFGGLSKKTSPDEVTDYISGMLAIATKGLEESRRSLDLFKNVRKAVINLIKDTNHLCDEEKTAIQERIFELERTKDVLEHFLNNIELYVRWWTRMNMTLNCQENSSKQLIKFYCSTRKEQIMTQWADLRTSFVQYADKGSNPVKSIVIDAMAREDMIYVAFLPPGIERKRQKIIDLWKIVYEYAFDFGVKHTMTEKPFGKEIERKAILATFNLILVDIALYIDILLDLMVADGYEQAQIYRKKTSRKLMGGNDDARAFGLNSAQRSVVSWLVKARFLSPTHFFESGGKKPNVNLQPLQCSVREAPTSRKVKLSRRNSLSRSPFYPSTPPKVRSMSASSFILSEPRPLLMHKRYSIDVPYRNKMREREQSGHTSLPIKRSSLLSKGSGIDITLGIGDSWTYCLIFPMKLKPPLTQSVESLNRSSVASEPGQMQKSSYGTSARPTIWTILIIIILMHAFFLGLFIFCGFLCFYRILDKLICHRTSSSHVDGFEGDLIL
ncbi:hypothetical protein CPB84DRAFT_1754670 [Gymnopilus junonius]|uniref:Uncharacterized protein n=1 Tax=Gymnopilus junonius TaxID=109634 RepID=A0A9P5TFM5_GYMJU|nr:hypothetical protein CPB84DRAFT_1754670 [Gymnopilus junonius]